MYGQKRKCVCTGMLVGHRVLQCSYDRSREIRSVRERFEFIVSRQYYTGIADVYYYYSVYHTVRHEVRGDDTAAKNDLGSGGVCGLGATDVVTCGRRDQLCLVPERFVATRKRARVVWSGRCRRRRRRRTITAVTGQRINARSCSLSLLLL